MKGVAYPSPETYTKSACRTLGFSARTNGYWIHSFHNWLVHALVAPTTNSIFMSMIRKIGRQAYEYAIAKKQKEP